MQFTELTVTNTGRTEYQVLFNHLRIDNFSGDTITIQHNKITAAVIQPLTSYIFKDVVFMDEQRQAVIENPLRKNKLTLTSTGAASVIHLHNYGVKL